MKISLIYPSWYKESSDLVDVVRREAAFPPLNLCVVAALARQAGWTPQIIDAHVEGLDDESILKKVMDFAPDLIGFTATTPFYANALRLAKIIKQDLTAPIIIGGSHVSYYREKALDDGFDYVVIGECETVLVDFLKKFSEGNRYPDVCGIMTRKEGEVLYKGSAPILKDLDNGPLPDRNCLKNEKYYLGTPQGTRHFTAVQMRRGCPFSCVFCATDYFGKKIRQRSVSNVIAELQDIIEKYGFEHIYFVDGVLTLDREYLLEFCDAKQKCGLKFTFEGNTRANLWDKAMALRLKESGLVRISFGLESADETVRKIIKKDVPLESYAKAAEINNKLGIATNVSVIIGLPGDTKESIERTVRYLCSEKEIQNVTLNIAAPYPGSEMFRMAEGGEYGLTLIQQDFSKYQRCGTAAMEVNDLKAKDLVRIQKIALMRIYACWWRWLPAMRRFGIKIGLQTVMRTLFSLMKGI